MFEGPQPNSFLSSSPTECMRKAVRHALPTRAPGCWGGNISVCVLLVQQLVIGPSPDGKQVCVSRSELISTCGGGWSSRALSNTHPASPFSHVRVSYRLTGIPVTQFPLGLQICLLQHFLQTTSTIVDSGIIVLTSCCVHRTKRIY